MEYLLIDHRTRNVVSAGCKNLESELDKYIFEQLQESVGNDVHWGKLADEMREEEPTS